MSITDLYRETFVQIRSALDWAPAPLASAIILLLAALFALVLHRLATNILLRLPGPRGTRLRWLVKQVRGPTRVFFVIAAVITALPVSGFSYRTETAIGQVLLVVFILLIGYSASLASGILSTTYLATVSLEGEDNLVARKHTTQIRILKRAADILIGLVAVGAALMTFEPVRQYGVSLFASAGAASVVVGLAARPLLTNLIAGVQIAITQPIRMEDAVIVEGEWGWVEEITSTYVVVRIWDWRRMILPISYFLEHPFQNWTHSSASLIGTVLLYTDFRAEVGRLRERLHEVIQTCPLWDGKVVNMQVADVSEHAMTIRILVSARNAPQTWDLRCDVREKMLDFIRTEMPEILPVTRVDLPRSSREIGAPSAGPLGESGPRSAWVGGSAEVARQNAAPGQVP